MEGPPIGGPSTGSVDVVILVAGEALIDLTHDRGADVLHAHPGGGPANTATALGRLGVPTRFLGAVGTDVFGDRLRRHLESAGVDTDAVVATDRPTTLALAAIGAGGGADYSFYLEGTSSAQLFPRHVPRPLPPEIDAIHVGTLGLVLEPTATTLTTMVIDEAATRVIAVDPNIRPPVVPDMATHRARLDTVMRHADLVRLSVDDAEQLAPDRDPEGTAARILGSGVSLVVLTRGGAGSVAFHRDQRIERPAGRIAVVDTIGAGDAFNAGLLTWLHDHDRLSKRAIAELDGDEVAMAVDFASAVAAVTVSRPGADPPHRGELAG